MGEVVVRAVDADHVDDVVELFAAYLQWYGASRERVDIRNFLHARVSREESLLLAAGIGTAAPVGFAQVYSTFSSVSMGPIWTLNDVYVAAEARGYGVGRALVAEVCRRGASAGVLRVQLETGVDNHVAQGLYAEQGFVRDLDVVLYRRLLVPG